MPEQSSPAHSGLQVQRDDSHSWLPAYTRHPRHHGPHSSFWEQGLWSLGQTVCAGGSTLHLAPVLQACPPSPRSSRVPMEMSWAPDPHSPEGAGPCSECWVPGQRDQDWFSKNSLLMPV